MCILIHYLKKNNTYLNLESKVESKLHLLAWRWPASGMVVRCERTLMILGERDGQNGFHFRGLLGWKVTNHTPRSKVGHHPCPQSPAGGMVRKDAPLLHSQASAPPASRLPSSPLPLVTALLSPLSFPPRAPLPHSSPSAHGPRVRVTHLLSNWSPPAVWVPVWKDILALGTASSSRFHLSEQEADLVSLQERC